MKIIKLFYITIFLFFLLLTKFAFSKMQNKIVMKVENEIITNYEIKNKILISLILAKDEINQTNINRLKDQALDSLILLIAY